MNTGMVLIAMTDILKTSAIGLGTMFDAPRKENGIANTKPTMVPRKAMDIVSKRRYPTPWDEKSNRNDRSG